MRSSLSQFRSYNTYELSTLRGLIMFIIKVIKEQFCFSETSLIFSYMHQNLKYVCQRKALYVIIIHNMFIVTQIAVTFGILICHF